MRYTIAMQFKVPQFIDIEDKIFGPLTFKQFAYLAGGGGLSYLAIKFLPGILALVVVPVCIAFALALTFYKYNEKPFIHLVESSLKFYTRSRLYLWHQKEKPKAAPLPQVSAENRGALTESKLRTLSWSLDVIDPNK